MSNKIITVLVVDDSKIARNIIVERIKELSDFKVIGQAENGYDAIEKYKKLKPDIVTMDITMPQINEINDGIEAIKIIKQIDNEAFIVMITSHGEERKVISAITNGARGYILKPVTTAKIKQVFRKYKEKLIFQRIGKTACYTLEFEEEDEKDLEKVFEQNVT